MESMQARNLNRGGPPPSCSKRISPRCVAAHTPHHLARHQRPVKRVIARASAGSLPPHQAPWRPVPPFRDGEASNSCPRFFSGFFSDSSSGRQRSPTYAHAPAPQLAQRLHLPPLVSAIPTAEREALPLDVRAVGVCAQSHADAALSFRLPQPAVGYGPPQQPTRAAP